MVQESMPDSVDQYADIWRLLKQYNFAIDAERVSRDLLCSICGGLVRDGQEGPCGCLYCLECIADLLDADGKYCPGKGGGCGQIVIGMSGEHQLDHPVNARVARVTVPCPIAFCETRVKLRAMRAHIDTHYGPIGDEEEMELEMEDVADIAAAAVVNGDDELFEVAIRRDRRVKLANQERAQRDIRSEIDELRAELVSLRRQLDAGDASLAVSTTVAVIGAAVSTEQQRHSDNNDNDNGRSALTTINGPIDDDGWVRR